MAWLTIGMILWLANGEDVELIAHRGESYDAPENTMAAFRLAWEKKDRAIELDVRLTRDGKLVVGHDADTKRLAGTKRVIKESTLEELRSLDAGRFMGPRWAGEKMPTLDEALATIPEGARCFIEIKVGPEAIPALVESVRRSGKRPEQLAIISFRADAVAEAKRRLPEIPAYFLSSFHLDTVTGAWQPSIDVLIDQAREIGADGLDLSWKGPLDRESARRIKAAGLGLYVWTVDDPDEARRLIEAGVDGITTNKPTWLRERLANEPAASR